MKPVVIASLTVLALSFGVASQPAHAATVYWSANSGDTIPGLTGLIQSVNGNGSGYDVLVELPEVLIGKIAIDSASNRMYRVEYDFGVPDDFDDDTQSIVRVGDGGCLILPIDIGSSVDIALDGPGGKIYWTETIFTQGVGRVLRADEDLSNTELLLDGLTAPGRIAVDTTGGKFYWYDFIDDTRMAAAGASYGGYMVAWIAGHTDRFKCLVDHDGVYNLASFYGATEELWFPEWEFGGTPWENPELYEKMSRI